MRCRHAILSLLEYVAAVNAIFWIILLFLCFTFLVYCLTNQ